ncbi:MAG: ABC transporter permease [Candidatus Nanopelagicales bacterium]|nr:ABC transporter permease [Candidatus Nanopelagicales bacterium]MDZ4249337.1 ABC transporter permease [Candidatus Nanopelagicales bacterium]
MTASRTLATAARVLHQIRHDHRTVALMLAVPILLMTLLKYVWIDSPELFNSAGTSLLGIFPFLVMFVVTSVATLRERQTGTLERLLAMPIGKGDLLVGYLLAFGLMALIQSVLAVGVSLWLLGLQVAGSTWSLTLVAVLVALLGTACGLALSAFAQTEFQAVQFMPAFVLPQFLLCGLLAPRDQMVTVLSAISDVLPLSYAVDATTDIATHAQLDSGTLTSMAVVAAFIVGAVGLGAATLRRRTP